MIGNVRKISFFFLVAVFFCNSIVYANEIIATYASIPANSQGKIIHLRANIYRPNDNNSHPLVIINHGRAASSLEQRKSFNPSIFDTQAKWFVNQGYAVVVPVRRGYGRSEGEDAEYSNPFNPYHIGMEGAKDIKAVIDYMKKEKYADTSKIVLIGQSCGGLVSMALASQNIEGVVGVINFAGGMRYNMNNNTDDAKQLFDTFNRFGKTTRISTLWIYTTNDIYFPPYLSQGMFNAFTKSGGKGTFKPYISSAGHSFFTKGMEDWQDDVYQYLALGCK